MDTTSDSSSSSLHSSVPCHKSKDAADPEMMLKLEQEISTDSETSNLSSCKRVSFSNALSIDEVPSVLNAPEDVINAYWYDVSELFCMKRDFKRMVMNLSRGEDLPIDDNGDSCICKHEVDMLKKAHMRRLDVVKTIEAVLSIQEEQKSRGTSDPSSLSDICSEKTRDSVKLALWNAKMLAKQQRQENVGSSNSSWGSSDGSHKRLGRLGMMAALSMIGRSSSPPKTKTSSCSSGSNCKTILRRETTAITTSHRENSFTKLLSWRRQGK